MATSCEMSSERDVELGRGGAREARKCWLSSLGERSDRPAELHANIHTHTTHMQVMQVKQTNIRSLHHIHITPRHTSYLPTQSLWYAVPLIKAWWCRRAVCTCTCWPHHRGTRSYPVPAHIPHMNDSTHTAKTSTLALPQALAVSSSVK